MAETCASQLITRKGIGRDKAAPMLLALGFQETAMIPPCLSELEAKIRDRLESVSIHLGSRYPDIAFSINSNYWGQGTNADGYIIYLSCLWAEHCKKNVDLIDLEISFNNVNTQPEFIADVCWGIPSGLIENEFSSDKVPFNKEAEKELLEFLPDLIKSLEVALKRGEPWE